MIICTITERNVRRFLIISSYSQLFDEPQSSGPARALGYFDQIVIFMAVICQCLESLPDIREAESKDDSLWGAIKLVFDEIIFYLMKFN